MADLSVSSSPDRTAVIVPCYNEAKRLDTAVFRQFLESSAPVRLVFVDDGSKDDTSSILHRLCAGSESRAMVVQCPVNGGKAEAVRRGLLHALHHLGPELVGYWDADLATPLDVIPRFVHILDTHPRIAMVFGSRVKLLGRFVKRQPRRHYLGRVFATVVSQMLRLPIYDTQCGAKLFRVDSGIAEILEKPFLSKWIFDVEIIARYIQHHGGNPALVENMIYEYPLERWEDVAGSKVRPGDFLTALGDVFKIRSAYLR